jgi:16S rRNA (uracil1498-N3)-methyltransferase
MARRRFFVGEVRNGKAVLAGEDAHHLTRVLRVEAGQKYEISDTHRVWLATVDTARKSVVEFAVDHEIEPNPEIADLTLCLALIKFDHFEWAVEKATELGVSRIIPFEALRSERGLLEGGRKRVERWRRIAKEASEQSRRLRPPEILDPCRFAEVAAIDISQRVWLDEVPGAPPLATLPVTTTAALAIGPEGGWAEQERSALPEAGWQPASLGPMVLRAETAVCAALAVMVQTALRVTNNSLK